MVTATVRIGLQSHLIELKPPYSSSHICLIDCGMNSPGVDEQVTPTSEANEKICICHKQTDGLVLHCHGSHCRCYNKIHPACFGMTDQDIQEALSSSW